MIDKWLDQMLLMEKVKAQMSATDIMQQNLDRQYLFYSPIGATLDRKARHIGFVEGNYMEMLKALNAARLRQKNLQMSTATLRVLNPPMFPLNAQPTNRIMILLGAFLLTFMLTALYFFVIELLDRTLRDRMRSERITKVPVMGCFPRESNLRYRRFNKTIADMSFTPDVEAATADQILPMIKSDLGIGFVPMDFLEKENRENLVILNMAPDIPARNICLLKRRGISLSIAASELENRIKDKKKEE